MQTLQLLLCQHHKRNRYSFSFLIHKMKLISSHAITNQIASCAAQAVHIVLSLFFAQVLLYRFAVVVLRFAFFNNTFLIS